MGHPRDEIALMITHMVVMVMAATTPLHSALTACGFIQPNWDEWHGLKSGRNRLRSAHEQEDLNAITFCLVVVVSGEAEYLLEHLPDGRRPLCRFGSETTANVFGMTSIRLVYLCYGCRVTHLTNKQCHGEVGLQGNGVVVGREILFSGHNDQSYGNGAGLENC